MNSPAYKFYEGEDAVLATMHGKERVISPPLESEPGLGVSLADGLATDRFGTFTREVERTGLQLDAARAKIVGGFDYAPSARVGRGGRQRGKLRPASLHSIFASWSRTGSSHRSESCN